MTEPKADSKRHWRELGASSAAMLVSALRELGAPADAVAEAMLLEAKIRLMGGHNFDAQRLASEALIFVKPELPRHELALVLAFAVERVEGPEKASRHYNAAIDAVRKFYSQTYSDVWIRRWIPAEILADRAAEGFRGG